MNEGVRARWQGESSAKGHTDNHDGELDTLLDLVAPASASERHDGWRMERDARTTSWATATAFSWRNTKAGWVAGGFKLRPLGGRFATRTFPARRRPISFHSASATLAAALPCVYARRTLLFHRMLR